MSLRRGYIDLDATASVTCNGCNNLSEISTINGALDIAREHHDIFDHEPHKPSYESDIRNIFSLVTGPDVLSIEVSSMNARLVHEGAILYIKHYAPSHLERIL